MSGISYMDGLKGMQNTTIWNIDVSNDTNIHMVYIALKQTREERKLAGGVRWEVVM